MTLAKYPFGVLVAALLTVALTTPISSFANIFWLSSMNMPMSFVSALEIILFDFQRLGILLYGVIIVEFAVAFSIAALIKKYFFNNKYIYPIAGAFITGFTLFVIVELNQTEILSGNRTILGKTLHCFAGFIGGYFFAWLVGKERKLSFAIRSLGIIYAYLLMGLVLNWIFTPINAAANFGFVFNELAPNAQNALLRDFSSFFLATFLFSILGVITLNPVWFFSAGIVYLFAGIFNLVGIYVYLTGFNQIFIGEFFLGILPIILGYLIIYSNRKSN